MAWPLAVDIAGRAALSFRRDVPISSDKTSQHLQETPMPSATRVDELIEAYYHRPVKEYVRVVSSIRESGGLTAEETTSIRSRLAYVDASTMVRQAGGPATSST